MNIDFGLTENQTKEKIADLVSNKEITMKIKENDTSYYRNININGKSYKCEIYFNDDRLKTGSLRSYSYDLATLPFAETGNDTINEAGYNLSNWKVIKISDFNNIKLGLDKKYGISTISTEKSFLGTDSIYKYNLKKVNLFLTHGKREDSIFMGGKVKVPFYTMAYITIKSKYYKSYFEKEKERRRKELKPWEILSISFKSPYIGYDYDENYNKVPIIVLTASMETYKTYVIDKDITKCKGIISILDSFNDTLFKDELVYKFSTPLISPVKQKWRTVKFNSYHLNYGSPTFNKISGMIKRGEHLKTRFRPTAVVLANGAVIK